MNNLSNTEYRLKTKENIERLSTRSKEILNHLNHCELGVDEFQGNFSLQIYYHSSTFQLVTHSYDEEDQTYQRDYSFKFNLESLEDATINENKITLKDIEGKLHDISVYHTVPYNFPLHQPL